jgi:hypothetical protein
VYELDHVPANIAVDQETSKVFFTFHPAAQHLPNELFPTSVGCRIAEIDKTKALGTTDPRAIRAFPSDEVQATMGNVHAIQVDTDKRLLWALDHGDGHVGSIREPRLFSVSLDTGRIEETYVFPNEDSGHFSHFGEMALSNDGRHIWIADRGSRSGEPSIVVFDRNQYRSWRAFSGHHVTAHKEHTLRVNGMVIALDLKLGVDSLDEDPSGEWVYFASHTDPIVWKVATKRLKDPAHYQDWALPDMEPHEHPIAAFNKTATESIIFDRHGQLFMADFEHSSIAVVETEPLPDFYEKKALAHGKIGQVTTVVQDHEYLRWPHSMAISETKHHEYLYITCSVSHELDVKTEFQQSDHAEGQGPFHIMRLRIWPHPKVNPSNLRQQNADKKTTYSTGRGSGGVADEF